jgi:hypothetical protein
MSSRRRHSGVPASCAPTASTLAVIALSSPIGIEALAREDASGLIAAHLDGIGGLGEEFAAWGPVALQEPDPGDVDRL